MPKTLEKPKKAAKKAATKKGKVHLFILMDESGSMMGKEESVTTGCNEFLDSFKKNKDARAWIAFFDESPGHARTRFKVKHEKVADVKELKAGDYAPRGMTPLNDAILESLSALDKKVSEDETVFMAIITDGLENASESSTEQVKAAIAKYEKRGWGFVYIGANQDAETTAASIGLKRKGQAFNFPATAGGVSSTMSNVSALATSRAAYGAGKAANEAYLANDAGALYTTTGGKFEEVDEDDDE